MFHKSQSKIIQLWHVLGDPRIAVDLIFGFPSHDAIIAYKIITSKTNFTQLSNYFAVGGNYDERIVSTSRRI